jgi:translocation and assembly module TamB
MRRWILAISVLSLFSGLALTVFTGWLLNTTAGAVWLLDTVSSAAGAEVTSGRVEGRLADELRVDNLVFAWPDTQIEIHKIKLDWDPSSVLGKSLKIHLLEIEHCVIRDSSPENITGSNDRGSEGEHSAIDFSVADLRFLPPWLVLEIEDLRFESLAIQDSGGAVTVFDAISGSFVASQHQIVSSAFSYLSPFVDFKGHFDWDLKTPHLEMIADVHLPAELVEHQMFKDIDVPVDFPGVLSLDGDWNDFSGPVSFGTETEGFSKVWLAADAQGSWQGINFENLRGHYLGGQLAGELDLWWIDHYRMHGKVLGTGLNPGIFLNDLQGLATLDVTGELFIPYDETPLNASISAEIVNGQLRGTNVSGGLALDWQYGDLYEVDIDLSSEDSRLFMQGKPAERLDVEASTNDMSSIYADLAGRLNSSGWLRWSEGYLTGELSGTGSDITWHEASLKSFTYQGRHLTKQSPIEIVIDGETLDHDIMQVEQVHAEVSGSLQAHNLLLTINEQTAKLKANLTGNYLDEVWKGQLLTLTGESSRIGSWSLKEPSSLSWNDESFTLENFVLEGSIGSSFALAITNMGASKDSSLSLDWVDVRHDWLEYLNPPFPVSGISSGQFIMKTVDHQPISLKAQLSGNLSLQNDYSPLEIPSITLNMEWIDTGLGLDLVADTEGGEHIELNVASTQPLSLQELPEQLSLAMKWQDIDLNRLSPLRKGMKVQGRSLGRVDFEILDGVLKQAKAEITAEAHMQLGSKVFGFRALNADLLWDENNFFSEAQVKGVHDGLMSLKMTSTADPAYRWPVSGDVELSLADFDLRSLVPFLTDDVDLVGLIRGNSSGYWRENGEVAFRGQFGAVDDTIAWKLQDVQADGAFQRADLDWNWQGSHLEGQLALQLASGGDFQGRWQLPFSAHWPFDFKTDGPITAGLKGGAQLSEIIPFFASGVFQDIRGMVTSDLRISGSLTSPRFSGTLEVSDAGAYLPVTGATIADLLLHISLQDDEVHLDKLYLQAGEGELLGTGLVKFDQWKLQNYKIELEGENLQLYNYPELQLFCNPDLTLSGDLTRSELRGSILIPEMKLIDKSTGAQSVPSDDVVISGQETDEREKLTFDTDIQVVVELGENVKVKTEGVETRLEGGVTIARDQKRHLAGWGEIRLVDGTYKAYGTSLQIKQGLMSYAGDPLINPKLRVFAAKDIGRVQAGVHITGTAQNPVVTLASNPAMPERDILGYLFMGRPISKDSEGGDALAIGAGALIPYYGGTFADYGIVELDLDGLLNDDGGVRFRKRLSESWEISSTLGTESGIDLFYILDFD